ncbi:MAG: MFS transporter [Fusobacteriaceae bacterium]
MIKNVENNLSLRTKLFYGMGVGYAIVDQIFAQWVLYFYLPPASSGLTPLLSAKYLGIAFGLSRIVDVVTDPAMGFISDKTNSRFGRRIPYIALGAIPLALATIGFFYPVKTNEFSTFIYLTVVGAIFFTFYTVVGGPYNSLIPDISKNQEDRLSLSTWQSVFRLFYTAIAMVLPGYLIKLFGKGDTLTGIRMMVIFLSCISVVGACFTIFGVNEKAHSSAAASKTKFFETIGILFKNKSFVSYLFGLLFFFVGFNTLRATMNYIVEDIMGLGKVAITIASGVLFGMSVLFFYPTTKIAKKFGYRKVMLCCLIALIFLSFAFFFLGRGIPTIFGFVIFAIAGIPVAGAAFIFPPAMLSDIGTKISSEIGSRIEGVCFGIQGFFLKMAFLISIVVLPAILSMGTQAVTKYGIYMTSIFSAVAFAISFIFYYTYKE